MRRSKFAQEQIIGMLKEHQAGATAANLCRKHRISDTTSYHSTQSINRIEGPGIKGGFAATPELTPVSSTSRTLGRGVIKGVYPLR